jgi:hypothetical protein
MLSAPGIMLAVAIAAAVAHVALADCGCTDDETCCKDDKDYVCCIDQTTYCVAPNASVVRLHFTFQNLVQWPLAGCAVAHARACVRHCS